MKHRQSPNHWGNMLSQPFIWAPFPFILIVDLLSEIYHQVCFPIYGLEKVKRSDYLIVKDRAKLEYLSFFEKVGCMYCGYVNGAFPYLKEISNRTEKYWCGIMHEKGVLKGQEHHQKLKFTEFGNRDAFDKEYGDK